VSVSCDASEKRPGAAEETRPADGVVEKVQAIIEALAREGDLGLTALARSSGVPKTTVHRLSKELEAWGVLERNGSRLTLGRRLAALGRLVPEPRSPRVIMRRYCEEFFAEFRIPVGVVMRRGLEVHTVEMVAGDRQPEMMWDVCIGARWPLIAGSTGKAILAFSSTSLLQAVIAQPLQLITPFSKVTPDKLRSELEMVRRTGYAVDRQEYRLGVSTLAVPVLNRAGEAMGSVGAPLPAQQRDIDRVQRGMKSLAECLGTVEGLFDAA
jgi:DNA-binding IclR family transcriptional regulator